ncbi:uncharacterized protein LOC114241671 [Bombyx mandarina]|uniref:Uncharacterized protein LOC114241671 n=1 Tax=Bombyx mandarina TaxID=7092 RepID=A0A6J2JFP1_BOMMA|nr:uncharacterized protein LOC114241671 [Bombyx mandarina]
MFLTTIVILVSTLRVQGFCGDSIRWSHHFKMDDVFGMWYGAGYAQHTPDMTNKPNEIGCVTLYITDVTTEPREDWLDWSIIRPNYSDYNWRSYKSNPWSDNSMSGSWVDVKIKRSVRRDMYSERRLRIIWDEDGQSMEQTYEYSTDEPGLWVAEDRRQLEREMRARGMDIWDPNVLPRHPQVIRILKASQHLLIINHCSEIGDGGIFTLILRRSPSKMNRWEWYDYQRQFFSFDLPNMYRYSTICAGCVLGSSLYFVFLCYIILLIRHCV